MDSQHAQLRQRSLRLRAALALLAVLAFLLLATYLVVRLLIGPGTALLATQTLLIGGGLLLATALLLYELLLLRPLTALRRELAALTEQQMPWVRLEAQGSDELAALVTALNDALDTQVVSSVQHHHEEQRVLLHHEGLQARRDFIATVSHELRTPLTPIGGFVDMLLLGLGGTLSVDQQVFLTTIKANTQRLTALVDDLLEMGRIDAGRVVLARRPADVQQLVAEAVVTLGDEPAQRRQTLTIELGNVPLLDADARRIVQVLANLLSNATKYTPAGGQIAVRAASRGDALVEIRVSDTGIGLSEEQQQQLFTPFYRADSPLRDEVSGTGLGLCIARALVELHGGTIWVESSLGAGATFAFTVPVAHHSVSSLSERTVGE